MLSTDKVWTLLGLTNNHLATQQAFQGSSQWFIARMRLCSESVLAPDWSSWWHGRSISKIVELRGSLGFIREGSQGGCKLEGGGKSPPSASCETSCEEIWANLTSHSQSLESLLCEVWWGMRFGDMESRMDVCSCYLWGTDWNTTHFVTSFLKLKTNELLLHRHLYGKVSRLKWGRMWVIFSALYCWNNNSFCK